MADEQSKITLNDAATQFLKGLPSDVSKTSAPEVMHFVSWFHGEKPVDSLTPMDVSAFSERYSASDTEQSRKLEILHKFLAYIKNEGWTGANLSVHLKARKEKAPPAPSHQQIQSDLAVVTQQGFEDIQKELESLRIQRPSVLEDIRRAAADKDFKENSPLHAAREQLGHIDGRIQELEAIAKSATIISTNGTSMSRVTLGATVVLVAPHTGKTQTYKIVGPKESDPAKGKISHVSPIGKAIIGKRQGDTVEVTVPAGKIKYRIDKVESK